MKNSILYLLAILFLLQSCTTYKTLDLNETPLKLGGTYKIRQDDKFIKAKLRTVSDSSITVVVDKNERIILLPEIKEIKERKISALKTTGLILSLMAIGGLMWSASTIEIFPGTESLGGAF
ncbi:hypothetical protein [Flavobacterium sp.]|uniref:hypothetical protein n=1 Tax=Flavobacterium sp. TaxID=239 RepID=UPI00375244C7